MKATARRAAEETTGGSQIRGFSGTGGTLAAEPYGGRSVGPRRQWPAYDVGARCAKDVRPNTKKRAGRLKLRQVLRVENTGFWLEYYKQTNTG
jgi:hypothetical protein